MEVFGTGGKVDAIDIALVDGADGAACRRRSTTILPAGTEVDHRRTGRRGVERSGRPVHRRVRHRPADLRVHHRVRQRVHHQQRLPDHDRSAAARAGAAARRRRLRPPGAADDHRRGVRARRRGDGRSASAGGVLVARLLVAAFNAAGAGFPSPQHRARAAHDRHGGARRHRHHHGVGDRAGASRRPGSRRSPRCAPSSGSPRCRRSGSSSASCSP